MYTLKFFAGTFLTALFLVPALSQAQTVSIVSGNGQLVCQDCPLAPQQFAPLVVQVNDATGKPVPGTTVTWTATQTSVATKVLTSQTNSAGQATVSYAPAPLFSGNYFFPATVVASALNASVQFVETAAIPYAQSGTAPVSVSLIPSAAPPPLVGLAGQTSATSLKVSVLGFYGPIPGILVSLLSGTAGHPSVGCATQAGQQPGTVLTDATGTATCTPVFGTVIGKGSYSLVIGGNFVSFSSEPLTVNQGPPAVIKIISGNNQSVNPGTKAPVALLAQVTDLAGNPSNLVPVKWSITAGTATLSNVGAATLSNGDVSAIVTPTAGPVQVVVALTGNTAIQAVFTVNVNVVITGLQSISGTPQSAKEGAAFANPLIVQVNDNAVPVPGATVNFVVTSGSATLSASSVVSNAQGQAQVAATAGATAGPVVITASVKSTITTYSQVFNLTVNPLGATIISVVNSAGFQNQFVSPCSLATIYGTGLADGLVGVAAAFIEPQTQVSGVSVQFGGVFAPILDVANVNGVESVSVQVPCEVPPSAAVPAATVPMVVTVSGTASAPFPVTVLPVSPGIFEFADTDGQTRAVLVRPDGSFASVSNPARRGEVIRMFVTGLGQTTPALFTNEFDPLVTDANNNLVAEVLPINVSTVVGINNSGVLVISAKYAYGMVGVYEVDFEVPQNTATGNSAPFAIAVYEGSNLLFANPSLIAIQ